MSRDDWMGRSFSTAVARTVGMTAGASLCLVERVETLDSNVAVAPAAVAQGQYGSANERCKRGRRQDKAQFAALVRWTLHHLLALRDSGGARRTDPVDHHLDDGPSDEMPHPYDPEHLANHPSCAGRQTECFRSV